MSKTINYARIPPSEIEPEARKIAVAWVEGFEKGSIEIEQKHKLASDIMNYSQSQLSEYKEKLKAEIEKLEEAKKENERLKQKEILGDRRIVALEHDKTVLKYEKGKLEKENEELKLKLSGKTFFNEKEVLESHLHKAKEMLNVSDNMYLAFKKTLKQLAQDGTAIDGFTESWKAVQEYAKSKLENEIESFLKS